ncbi:glycosyltransferase family 4 protein [Saccharicrinis aurantiacus]|uniref:glycosyltransferase family 4 protein n=1 Tax=Saccharicrinis aurantiacus TaxID=1849719 RepID=UPI00094F9E3A|nr:glycosyltransferase family 1 protein [Saccharicrinis aurantiacus]
MQTPIHLFFRKKLGQFNSIEEIFNALLPELQEHHNAIKAEVPESSICLKGLYANIKFARQFKGIKHITGHINYLTPFLGKNTILTIHDVGSNLYGNCTKRILLKTFWLWIPALFAKKITVISEFSKQELSAIVPFAKNKIQVIHNPIKPELHYTPKVFNKTCPTLLHLGTKDNKNLERTIEAIKDIPCQLHIIGKLNNTQLALLDKYDINYKNQYYIPYSEIIEAYKQCDILSFASTYEGFGMPIIEAQAIGRPVLTSNCCSMPEVAADAALLINPRSSAEITQGIQKIINDDTFREQLIPKGLENVKRFDIKEIARQYGAIYKSL